MAPPWFARCLTNQHTDANLQNPCRERRALSLEPCAAIGLDTGSNPQHGCRNLADSYRESARCGATGLQLSAFADPCAFMHGTFREAGRTNRKALPMSSISARPFYSCSVIRYGQDGLWPTYLPSSGAKTRHRRSSRRARFPSCGTARRRHPCKCCHRGWSDWRTLHPRSASPAACRL